MVLSRLNPKITYADSQDMEQQDVGTDTPLYEVDILNVPNIVIALGSSKTNDIDSSIVSYPIYLVKDGEVSSQLGVYEINADQIPNVLDSDGDIDIDLLGKPLLYSFVNDTFLKQATGESEKLKQSKDFTSSQQQEEEEEAEEKEEEEEIDSEEEEEAAIKGEPSTKEKDDSDEEEALDKEISQMKPETEKEAKTEKTNKGEKPDRVFDSVSEVDIIMLPEEDNEESLDIETNFVPQRKKYWIQKFMKNDNYNVIDNEGGGDCLFAAIRDAFRQVGMNMSVAALRARVAEEATEEDFKLYKENYDMYANAIHSATEEMKLFRKKHRDIKKLLGETKSRTVQQQIVSEAKELSELYSKTKSEQAMSMDLLKDYGFMKDVKTLDAFRAVINKPVFWGDAWTISKIETILNVKLILLSEEEFDEKNYKNVLQCTAPSPELEQLGIFDPKYYIIMDYTGSHYKLVTYKQKMIFTFKELPYRLKEMIVGRCLERDIGVYGMIPDFVNFKEQLGLVEKREELELGEGKGPVRYDPETVFELSTDSNSKKLPGKGVGEKIQQGNEVQFAELHKIPKWREKLSFGNIDKPFVVDNNKYSSIKHALEACKYKKQSPEIAHKLSLESGSELSKRLDLLEALSQGNISYKGKEFLDKRPTVDLDFKKRRHEEMGKILAAKILHDPTFKRILTLTKNAKLVTYRPGKHPRVEYALMDVRDKIADN